MSHYAKVLDGKVINVIVADEDFMETFVDTEPGDWIKTSYNMFAGKYLDPETGIPVEDQSIIDGDEARERKNFASTGGNYDYDGDFFYEAQPYNSWTLNTSTGQWEAPEEYPTDGEAYIWNEDDLTWEQMTDYASDVQEGAPE